jgi:hypothetical protein
MSSDEKKSDRKLTLYEEIILIRRKRSKELTYTLFDNFCLMVEEKKEDIFKQVNMNDITTYELKLKGMKLNYLDYLQIECSKYIGSPVRIDYTDCVSSTHQACVEREYTFILNFP